MTWKNRQKKQHLVSSCNWTQQQKQRSGHIWCSLMKKSTELWLELYIPFPICLTMSSRAINEKGTSLSSSSSSSTFFHIYNWGSMTFFSLRLLPQLPGLGGKKVFQSPFLVFIKARSANHCAVHQSWRRIKKRGEEFLSSKVILLAARTTTSAHSVWNLPSRVSRF